MSTTRRRQYKRSMIERERDRKLINREALLILQDFGEVCQRTADSFRQAFGFSQQPLPSDPAPSPAEPPH